MKRRVLLVDDEVAVLLTLKAVLEISGYDVDTATSAREGKARIRHREYEMVITDMRMEDERSGEAVIEEARSATYKPAVALLTAFPIDELDWQDMGADQLLIKPMHTRALLQQLEELLVKREAELEGKPAVAAAAPVVAKKSAAKRSATVKRIAAKKVVVKKAVAKKVAKKAVKKAVAKKPAAKKVVAKKPAAKKVVAKKIAGKKAVAKKVVKKAIARKVAKKPVAKKKVVARKKR